MKKQIIIASLGLTSLLSSSLTLAANHVWAVKCLDPSGGHTIHVKAITMDGQSWDIKGIESSSNDMLHIKAISNSKEVLPVKVLPNSNKKGHLDVKSTQNGNVVHIKGITNTGKLLDVKAIRRPDQDKYHYDIKCVMPNGALAGLKAISPTGQVYDIKGFGFLPNEKTLDINIQGHIKGVPQRHH